MMVHERLASRGRPANRCRRGMVLLATLSMVVVVAALIAALLATAHAELRQAHTTRSTSDVRNLAEAATVAAEQSVIVAVANSLPPPAQGSLQLGPHAVPWTTTLIGVDTTQTDAVGIQTIHQHYRVDATATLGNFAHTVHRVLDVGLTPIFQYAIFYERDLELLPGPSMTLSGRVHTNQDMYVGVGSKQTLTVNSNYFRSVGNMHRTRKDDGSLTLGNVKIQQTGSSSLYDLWSWNQLNNQGVPSTSGYDSDFLGFDKNNDGDLNDVGDWADFAVGALTTWNGTVQTAAHGVKRVEPPTIGSIQRYEVIGAGLGDHEWDPVANDFVFVGAGQGDARKGHFHANAELVIRDLNAYDAKGFAVAMPAGALVQTTMYDAREGRSVTVTEIDVGVLRSNGLVPKNGLIYASRSDASSSQPNGVRLKNGSELGQPLTICSEDPLYVLGDYNTTNKQPASIVSDAVNLLSNGWDDSKTAGTLPVAKATTFNAAMITGNDETVGSQYSGGFENLPRFHEDWTGVTCTILGSFVKIYGSVFATGKWVYGGDHYTAPVRKWDYDTTFNNASSLPPFTPNVAQVHSAGWWE